jgi:hypothetical protein
LAVPALLLAALAVVLIYERGNTRVTPYSANDRRMTFAALPALFSVQEARDVEVASANTDAYRGALERNDWWAHTAEREATQQATMKFHSVHEIAKALNVHFLLRGTLRRTQTGHAIDLRMLDGESEREIAADTVTFDDPHLTADPAAVDYATEDYGSAVKHAQGATANMTEEESKNATTGADRLTLAAAEARLGNMEQARASLEELRAAVPEATTIGKIRRWLYPTADLYGFEPLFDGLRLAGLSD